MAPHIAHANAECLPRASLTAAFKRCLALREQVAEFMGSVSVARRFRNDGYFLFMLVSIPPACRLTSVSGSGLEGRDARSRARFNRWRWTIVDLTSLSPGRSRLVRIWLGRRLPVYAGRPTGAPVAHPCHPGGLQSPPPFASLPIVSRSVHISSPRLPARPRYRRADATVPSERRLPPESRRGPPQFRPEDARAQSQGSFLSTG